MRWSRHYSVAGLLAGLGAVLLLASALAQHQKTDVVCLNYSESLAAGILMYTQDYDEMLPPMRSSSRFESVVSPYLKSRAYFVCPATNKRYAPTASMSEKSLASFTLETVLLQDSQAHADGYKTLTYLSGDAVHPGVTNGDPGIQCVENARKSLLALQMYTQDYDQVLPPMGNVKTFHWLLFPYTRQSSVLMCPATHLPFTPNKKLSYVPLYTLSKLSSTVAFYDSRRHQDGYPTLAYLDGHVTHPGITNVGTTGPGTNNDELCLSNMKRVMLGMQMYLQDYDERFPPMDSASQVQQLLLPYVQDTSKFICPVTLQPFQPNLALSYLYLAAITSPASTVVFSDPVAHPNGKRTYGYADGTSKQK